MLGALRAHPPRLIATLNAGWTFFIDAPEYFLAAYDFATRGYRLVARHGRFDVLAREDVARSLPREIAVEPPATAVQATKAWLPARRQAARRWMEHLSPADAAGAQLPDDPRDAILLLRALRDGGDLRGVGWLLAGYSSTSPRIRREAESAMERVAQEFEARRFRWAGDFEISRYAAYVRPYAGLVPSLAAGAHEGPRRIAAIIEDLSRNSPAADAAPRRGR
jgi:hypothetical protein